MSMDVINQREFLRVYKNNKRVFNREGKAEYVKDMVPISVELDNQYGYSEETDLILWDDTNKCLIIFTNNQANNRGSNYIMGTDKPLNPCMAIIVDYDFIQQMKVTVDEECFMQLTDKAIARGLKVNYHGAEVPVTKEIAKNMKYFMFDTVDPKVYIEKDKQLRYSPSQERIDEAEGITPKSK